MPWVHTFSAVIHLPVGDLRAEEGETTTASTNPVEPFSTPLEGLTYDCTAVCGLVLSEHWPATGFEHDNHTCAWKF